MIHRPYSYKECHRMNHTALSGTYSGSTCSLQWADLLEPRREIGHIRKLVAETRKRIIPCLHCYIINISNCKAPQNQIKVGLDELSLTGLLDSFLITFRETTMKF